VTRSEYLRAQTRLVLPPGATWPKYPKPPGNTVTGRGAGAGLAVLIAQNRWECYRVGAIRTHDVAGARRAHAQLNELLARNIVVAPAGASENWTPSNPTDTPLAVYADDGGLDQCGRRMPRRRQDTRTTSPQAAARTLPADRSIRRGGPNGRLCGLRNDLADAC
jgi:hypothetical protein